MKNAGFILLVMAILSLLGALFSYGRDYDTAGGRFMGALILGGIGILLLYLNNKKENDEYEDYEYESDKFLHHKNPIGKDTNAITLLKQMPLKP